MKANWCGNWTVLGLVGGLVLTGANVVAQNNPAGEVSVPSGTAAQAGVAAEPTPHFAYGVQQVLQLSRAKVSDDTIVTYVRSSGNSYGLTADQIIYLQQQGVSSVVLNTMLSQPRPGVLASAPATTPAMQPAVVTPTTDAVVPAPTVTYVQTQPATVYYYEPYYYNYGYPYYGNYWPTISVGWGWGHGRGWHGGWHGGGVAWHGGGFHGGGFHGGGVRGGFHGGGFHGGGFHR